MKVLPIISRYVRVWLMIATTTLQEAFVNRWSNLLFFTAKLVRFSMMIVFLLILKNNTIGFGSYTTTETILFFLVFNLVDLSAQVLFRGVYLFSRHIREGTFDFYLIKPVSPLFQSLFGKPDINDALFLILTGGFSIWFGQSLGLTLSASAVGMFGALLINSLILVTALHIGVLSLAVLVTEVDNVVWFYRDLMQFGRFPVSIYAGILRTILLYLIPIGVLTTIPAEVLLGRDPSLTLATSLLIGVVWMVASLRVWHHALRRYSSASS